MFGIDTTFSVLLFLCDLNPAQLVPRNTGLKDEIPLGFKNDRIFVLDISTIICIIVLQMTNSAKCKMKYPKSGDEYARPAKIGMRRVET
jgi:hypothetical protein